MPGIPLRHQGRVAPFAVPSVVDIGVPDISSSKQELDLERVTIDSSSETDQLGI